MRLSELFYSIQGEGKLAGVPSVFVRTSGCNLRCVWCDTPYASWAPAWVETGIDAIVRRVNEHPARHVVLTGGEPMIAPDIESLAVELKRAGHHLTVETAGTVFKPLPLDLASLSPKLSNSTPHEREGGRFAVLHEAKRLDAAVLQRFIDDAPDVQLKFVVMRPADFAEIDALLSQLTGWTPADVLLMPEGRDAAVLAERSGWLAEACKARGNRFCPRLHVALYGDARGT